MNQKMLLLILLMQLICFKILAQPAATFKPIGNYQWVIKNVISNPEKLPYKKYECKAEKEIIPKQKKQVFKRKANFITKILPRKFTLPSALPLVLKGKPIQPSQKILAPPFLFKDNALFNLTYIDKAHGFISDAVSAITEDNEHNIWIATDDAGLIKYDGLYYYLYNKNCGFISNTIINLKFEPSNGLWVATSEGIAVIKKDSLFQPVFKSITNSDLSIASISIDAHKNIWVSTVNYGAFMFNTPEQTVRQFDTSCGLTGNSIIQAYKDKKDNYWFINTSITKIEGNTIVVLTEEAQTAKPDVFDDLLSIMEDRDTIWIGSFSKGLFKITPKDTLQVSIYKNFSGRSFDIVKCVDAIWFAIYGGGLCYLKGDEYILFDETNGLGSKSCYRLLVDSYNNIWTATLTAGISRLNESSIITETDIPAFLANTIQTKVDSEGNRWYFINGGRIVKETPTHYEIITNEKKAPLYSGHWFFDGAFNADGSIWMAAHSQGIALYQQNRFNFYQLAYLPEPPVVMEVQKGQNNTIWASTEKDGLLFFRNNTLFHLSIKDGLLDNHATKLASDKSGALLCLTGKGIQKISNDTLYNLYLDNKQVNFSANCFYATNTDDCLIGTTDKGLLLMKDNMLYAINKVGDIDFNLTTIILDDKKGITWLTNPQGIIRFRKEGLHISEIKSFNSHSGLMLPTITGGAYIDDANIPHFSVTKGYIKYKPEFENAIVQPPFINYSSATINGKNVQDKGQLTVYPNDELNLYYNIICWGYENQVTQKYALIKTSSKDTAEFAIGDKGIIKIKNLFSDDYSICIVAISFGKKHYSHPIHLVVKPYWYNSIWFYVLCCLIILVLIVAFFLYRTHRLQQSKQALERTVSKRTVQLQTSLGEREMLLKEIHHRVKNNLQVISGLLELQKEEMTDDKVKSAFSEGQSRVRSIALIHQNLYQHETLSSIHFKEYVPELLNYLGEVFKENRKAITVQVKGEDVPLDIDTAVPLGLIINELLTNAYKYAHPENADAEVVLYLKRISADEYQMIYSDNGPGIKGTIDFDTANSLGLRLIKGLIGQLAGSVSYHYNNGAVFTFIFKDAAARARE